MNDFNCSCGLPDKHFCVLGSSLHSDKVCANFQILLGQGSYFQGHVSCLNHLNTQFVLCMVFCFVLSNPDT